METEDCKHLEFVYKTYTYKLTKDELKTVSLPKLLYIRQKSHAKRCTTIEH